MTPSLTGRLHTRLVLLPSLGLLWTLLVTPLLAGAAGISVSVAYRVTLESALATTLLGLLWEFLYHGIQQLRWDKDWPTMLALVTVVSEAIPVWLVLHALHIVPGDWGLSSPILGLYTAHFLSTWIVVWMALEGPLRVFVLRWRFEGGTFSRRPPDHVVPLVVSNIGMVFTLVAIWLAWQR